MNKILIVEDEDNIRELVKYNLIMNDFEVIESADGLEGLELARKDKPDLLLLDLMLPGKNGLDICKELRTEGSKVPIVLLTAKNEELDKVIGLELGADDYITKPFGVHELMARIKAVLRRFEISQVGELLCIDALSINIEKHEVKIGEEQVYLALKEFELLKTLVENRGRVMSRNQLLDKVWGIDYIGETRTVDVHIRYLRKKLNDEDSESKYIQTIRGIGYKII